MTRHSISRHLTRAASALLPALAISLSGCGGGRVLQPGDASGTTDPASLVAPAPDPVTPEAALYLLSWAMNQRDWRRYSENLTDDFQFAFGAVDSAGNAYRDRSFTRADEIVVARNMFETGTALEPPFSRVVMTLDRRLFTLPDPRPGKDSRFHQVIRANLVILAENFSASYRIVGAGNFYLVRGDSAQIPPELQARGIRPDPSRWWVERWEDETLSSPSGLRSAAMPTSIKSWGALKVLYR